jgi:hypothetical protein
VVCPTPTCISRAVCALTSGVIVVNIIIRVTLNVMRRIVIPRRPAIARRARPRHRTAHRATETIAVAAARAVAVVVVRHRRRACL